MIFIILVFQDQCTALKAFDFLDYKDVRVEDSGWLQLKQDSANPLYLPHTFAFCTNYFNWYRSTGSGYTPHLTLKLLDKNRNYRSEFTFAQWGTPLLWEYAKRKYNYVLKENYNKDKHQEKNVEWVHVCGFLDMKKNLFGFYINGDYLGDTPANDDRGEPPQGAGPILTFEEEQQFDLYIGTHRTEPGNMANRIIGMIQGFNMFTYVDHP